MEPAGLLENVLNAWKHASKSKLCSIYYYSHCPFRLKVASVGAKNASVPYLCNFKDPSIGKTTQKVPLLHIHSLSKHVVLYITTCTCTCMLLYSNLTSAYAYIHTCEIYTHYNCIYLLVDAAAGYHPGLYHWCSSELQGHSKMICLRMLELIIWL